MNSGLYRRGAKLFDSYLTAVYLEVGWWLSQSCIQNCLPNLLAANFRIAGIESPARWTDDLCCDLRKGQCLADYSGASLLTVFADEDRVVDVGFHLVLRLVKLGARKSRNHSGG